MTANPRFSLSLKGVVLICLPLVFELVFVIVLTNLARAAEADAAAAVKSAQLIQQGHRLVELAFAAASGCQGYASTGNPLYRDLYKRAVDDFPAALQVFADSPASNEEQKLAQQQIRTLANRYLTILANDISPGGLAQEEKSISAEVLSMLQNRIVDFLGEEEDIRQQRFLAQAGARQHLNQMVFIAVGCNLLLAIFLSLFFSAHITKRLRIMTDNTKRLSDGLALNAPVQGNDEIAQLDKVFHDMAKSLAELEKIKREFVAMVTHDLRVPLTSIQLFLQSMEGGMYGEIPEDMHERAIIAERNAEQMLRLIKDLLDIAQLESGTFTLKMEAVDLNQIIEDSIETIQPLATERKISIARELPEHFSVFADANRIKQVLTNLLSNAIKFSPENTSVVVACDAKQDELEVSIADSGRGIPPELQPHLFERFKRDTAAGEAGSGLGLAICKALVEKHGGTIGVRSEEGKGTTFWFQLHRLTPQPAAPSASKPIAGAVVGMIALFVLCSSTLSGCGTTVQARAVTEADKLKSQSLLTKTRTQFAKQDLAGAAQSASEAVKADPQSHMAYLLHGYALFKLGKPADAIKEFDRAAQLSPSDYQSFEYRASAYQQMQRFRKALQNYRLAISVAPADRAVRAKLYRELAMCNLAFGQLDDALTALAKAIELAPKDPELYTARAIAELHLDRPKESVIDATTAINLDGRNILAYQVRSRAYESMHEAALSDADELRARMLYSTVTPM